MIDGETILEDHEHAAPVLDKAIAKVFRNEFNRISEGLGNARKASKVNYAIDELAKLQQRQPEMPKYDKWVAPFYLSWHQPSQINLTYSMVTDIVAEDSIGKEIFTDTGRLYVFDFGCGALAMQFGVVLAIADALQNNQKIHSAYIASYDKSKAMKNIGKMAWEQFRSEVQKDASLPYLEQACALIETQTDKIRRPRDNEMVWISAIHAAYPTNKDKVQKDLAWLTDEFRPSAGFVTSHVMESEVVDFISPFHHNNEYKTHKQTPYDIFRGELSETTKARSALNRCIQGLKGRTIKYLNNSVTWKCPSPVIRLYTRRQS